MNVVFKVHGVSKVPVSMETMVGDEKVVASVPCLEVELVTEAAISGSLTLRFFGKDMPAAEALYVQDALINSEMTSA